MTNVKKYERAQKLVAQGESVEFATKKLNLSKSTYGYYKRKEKLEKPKRKYKKRIGLFDTVPISLPEVDDFMFKGSPRSVAKFIKEMHNQFGGAH